MANKTSQPQSQSQNFVSDLELAIAIFRKFDPNRALKLELALNQELQTSLDIDHALDSNFDDIKSFTG